MKYTIFNNIRKGVKFIMNMNKIINSIITSEGLYNLGLPFKDAVTKEIIPIEQVLFRTIAAITIPQYSQFVPWIRIGDCSITDLKVIDQRESIYNLPVALTLTPIQYVVDVRMPFYNTRGTYGDVAPGYGINRSVQGVITAQSYMMLAGQMRAEPTFEYLGNNKIKLYGFPKTILTFEVACDHEPNGETIEDGCYDSFLELATYDVQIMLYNNLKRYKNIPSAHGNLNLEIDDYANAKDKKETWLEKARDTFHLDLPYDKWM